MIKSLVRTLKGPSRDPRMALISRPLPRDLLDEQVLAALEIALSREPGPRRPGRDPARRPAPGDRSRLPGPRPSRERRDRQLPSLAGDDPRRRRRPLARLRGPRLPAARPLGAHGAHTRRDRRRRRLDRPTRRARPTPSASPAGRRLPLAGGPAARRSRPEARPSRWAARTSRATSGWRSGRSARTAASESPRRWSTPGARCRTTRSCSCSTAPTAGTGSRSTTSEARRRGVVPPTGFEPVISTLKGWRPRPLDDGGADLAHRSKAPAGAIGRSTGRRGSPGSRRRPGPARPAGS